MGTRGAAVRLYDPFAQQWTIYWASSRDSRLQPAVRGRFTDGVGHFEGDDTHEGRPIKVRFFWSEITETTARWHQDFSDNDGRSWEANWIMEFARASEPGHAR